MRGYIIIIIINIMKGVSESVKVRNQHVRMNERVS